MSEENEATEESIGLSCESAAELYDQVLRSENWLPIEDQPQDFIVDGGYKKVAHAVPKINVRLKAEMNIQFASAMFNLEPVDFYTAFYKTYQVGDKNFVLVARIDEMDKITIKPDEARQIFIAGGDSEGFQEIFIKKVSADAGIDGAGWPSIKVSIDLVCDNTEQTEALFESCLDDEGMVSLRLRMVEPQASLL